MKVKLKPGDTLLYYSRLFMVPLDLIIDSNPGIDPKNPPVGKEVKIPGVSMQSYPNRVTNAVVNHMEKYDSSILHRDLANLEELYPFIKVKSIGKSVLGNPIPEIKIGSGRTKKININASFHANEWITTSVLMRFVNDYLLALTNCHSLNGLFMLPYYQSVELSIVPMVNPDGVNLVLNGPPKALREELVNMNKGRHEFTAWKANIRGVDLNNQFPAKWEIEKGRKEPKEPASRDYPGDTPLSEPEAVAMAELVQLEQFDRLIALHTQGSEFYWGYEGLEAPESTIIAKEFERVSGYKAVQYVDSHAGFKDWFIQEFRKPGFTIELGKGINPLPLSQFQQIYEKVLPIMLAALYT
ncbi:M14 family metallopeptidase [Bacillus marasmi]|uniref:M14 family metallopeptidase n=1 Tax=Bacillus marasmi TaxID=1926279 RepID=UPI0011CC6922|nr:M14 family metallopeptidase [Bacillus marasmi]